MAISGSVLRKSFPPICFSSSSNELKSPPASIVMRRNKSRVVPSLKTRFSDQSHLQFYNRNPVGIVRSEKLDLIKKQEKGLKKMKKNKTKLLKGLSKDLSSFSQISFGLDSDGALVDDVKSNMLSEAAELLLEQLQKLKAEEKELKRKKQEEKAKLKALQSQNKLLMKCESSSSSSSSESDNECEVVDMKSLKKSQANKYQLQPVIETSTLPNLVSTPILADPLSLEKEITISSEIGLDNTSASKKIEVCMGGKCKKSGAGALIEELQRAVGIEGAVSGCKCMGKCKEGPNVRVNVVNGSVPSNALCIGVGLDNVETIVANFLGGDTQHQLRFVV